MARELKVYGWQSSRSEAPGRHKQTREIVAAHSAAEVARITGDGDPRRLFNLGETGNSTEIAVATAEPGVVFWRWRGINELPDRAVWRRG